MQLIITSSLARSKEVTDENIEKVKDALSDKREQGKGLKVPEQLILHEMMHRVHS